MYTVKVEFPPGELRKLTVNDFQELHSRILKTFPSLEKSGFRLNWTDTEGDQIIVTNKHDFEAAVVSQQKVSERSIRFTLIPNSSLPQAETTTSTSLVSVESQPESPQELTTSKSPSTNIPSNSYDLQISDPQPQPQSTLSHSSLELSMFPAAPVDVSIMGEAPTFPSTTSSLSSVELSQPGSFPNPVTTISSASASAPALIEERPIITESDRPAVHTNVICDQCKCNPIVGIRYKCTECFDFDLCATCNDSGVHPLSHVMLQIRIPTRIIMDCDSIRALRKRPTSDLNECTNGFCEVSTDKVKEPQPQSSPHPTFSNVTSAEYQEEIHLAQLREAGFTDEVLNTNLLRAFGYEHALRILREHNTGWKVGQAGLVPPSSVLQAHAFDLIPEQEENKYLALLESLGFKDNVLNTNLLRATGSFERTQAYLQALTNVPLPVAPVGFTAPNAPLSFIPSPFPSFPNPPLYQFGAKY